MLAFIHYQLTIKRRFAVKELYKRFYATWTKEYDPYHGKVYWLNK